MPQPAQLGRFVVPGGDAARQRFLEGHFFVKRSGSMLNPLNWPQMLRALFLGHPERSCGLRPIGEHAEEGPVIIIDGADDLVSALQGTGLPQQLVAAVQSVFYPLCMGIIAIGYEGAEDEARECRAEALELNEELRGRRREIARMLARDLLLKEAALELMSARATRPRAKALVDTLQKLAATYDPCQGPLGPGAAAPGRRVTDAELDALLVRLGPGRTALRELTEAAAALRAAPAREGPTPATAPSDAELVRRLVEYQRKLDERFVPALMQWGSKLAEVGTGMMWWGMAGYEGAALCTLTTWGAGVNAFTTLGNYALPVGQAAMAAYGVANTAVGAQRCLLLHRHLRVLAESGSLKAHPQVREVLEAQLRAEQRLHAFGKLGGGPLLTAGQLMMIAGGPVVGVGLPVLIAGASLTVVAIAMRVWSDHRLESEFGFSPEALDLEPIRKAWGQLPSGGIGAVTEGLVRAREAAVRKEAWTYLLQQAHRLNRRLERLPPERRLELLLDTLRRHSRDPVERELRAEALALAEDPAHASMLMQQLRNPRDRAVRLLTACHALAPDEDAASGSQTHGHLSDGGQRASSQTASARLRHIVKHVEDMGLAERLQQHVLERLVVTETGLTNRHGGRYSDLLERIVVTKRSRLTLPLVGRIPVWRRTKTAYALRLDQLLDKLEADPDGKDSRRLSRILLDGADAAIFGDRKRQIHGQLLATHAALLTSAQYEQTAHRIAAGSATTPVVSARVTPRLEPQRSS